MNKLNILDLEFCLGYCAAITSVEFVDQDGQPRYMNAFALAKLLDSYAIAAPQHDIEGQITGGRSTDGYAVTETAKS